MKNRNWSKSDPSFTGETERVCLFTLYRIFLENALSEMIMMIILIYIYMHAHPCLVRLAFSSTTLTVSLIFYKFLFCFILWHHNKHFKIIILVNFFVFWVRPNVGCVCAYVRVRVFNFTIVAKQHHLYFYYNSIHSCFFYVYVSRGGD